MAYLRAFSAFDVRTINLNKLISGQISWQHISNANAIFDQKLYQDVSIFEYYYQGYATGIFGGRNITYSLFSDGYYKPISGTVTGYIQLNGGRNSTEIMWYVSGFEYPATEFSNAAFTSDTSDDFRIISNVLSGNDLLELSDYDDIGAGYDGNDEIYGGRGADALFGLAGNDKLYGGSGSDILNGGEGADYLDGGSEFDYASYGDETSGVIVNLANGTARTASGNDTLVSIEGVFGSPFADDITGDQYQNVFGLSSGKDVIRGGGAQFGDIIRVAGSFSEYAVTRNADGSFSLKKPGDASVDTTLFDVTKIYSDKEGVTKDLASLLPNNSPSFSAASRSFQLLEDATQTIRVEAADPDGDSLVYSISSGPANGRASVDVTTVYYTPNLNFNGADSFVVRVSDGRGGVATQTINVTVTAVNDAPTFSTSSQSVSATAGGAQTITLAATDVDGDALTYTTVTPSKGSATISGSTLTYTPTSSATGTDSFTVTASDGKGGTATQTISVTISAATTTATQTFRLVAPDGWVGSVGGNGSVVGTSGFQDVRITSGSVSLDGSFNTGNDIVRLDGNASGYSIVRSGSAATISKGSSASVTVPIGTTGAPIVFDDGPRKLVFSNSNFNFGSQTFSTTQSAITAGSDGTALPTGASASAVATAILAGTSLSSGQTFHISIAGTAKIVGTSVNEIVQVISSAKSSLTFDPSFNQGGDVIVLGRDAGSFTAQRSSSSMVLVGPNENLTIPIGTAGLTLRFTDGDRTLVFSNGEFKIGTQSIGTTAIQLTGATTTTSIDVGTGASPVTLNASTGAVNFTDNANTETNVRITGFGADDRITVTGATSSRYSFTTVNTDGNSTADLVITFNNTTASVVNSITLVEAVSANAFVADYATAQAAIGNAGFMVFG